MIKQAEKIRGIDMDMEKHNPGPLATPLSQRGFPVIMVYLLSLLGIIYLINPTAGFIELIPDNIPFFGNIDEGVAAFMVWYGLLEFFEGRKNRRKDDDDIIIE